MANITFAQVAEIVGKACVMTQRAGKSAHAFPIRASVRGTLVPSWQIKLIAARTGVDLSVPADLARVILASASADSKVKLFTDGTRIWDSTAEAERKRKADVARDTAQAIRAEYREAIAATVEDQIKL